MISLPNVRLYKLPTHQVSYSFITSIWEMWLWSTIPHLILHWMLKLKRPNNILFSCGNSFFKPVRVKGNGSCLYSAIASHITTMYFHDLLTKIFLLEKKNRNKKSNIEGGQWFKEWKDEALRKWHWKIWLYWSQQIFIIKSGMGLTHGILSNDP